MEAVDSTQPSGAVTSGCAVRSTTITRRGKWSAIASQSMLPLPDGGQTARVRTVVDTLCSKASVRVSVADPRR